MDHPTARVLALLELLQANGRVSGTELARRLGVHGRTLRRYVARLEEMGIPVTAERGRTGAYQLVAGFRLPPMLFTDAEAVALTVGLAAARGLGLGGAASAVASAQAKLARVLPAALRRRVRALDEAVTLAPATGQAGAADPAVLGTLAVAAQEQRRVRLRYRARDGVETARRFDPYGLVHRGRWYVVGHCGLRGAVRSFRLDRVAGVEPLEERFERPAGFDPLAHLTDSLARLPRAHAAELLLRTDPATARAAVFGALGVVEPAEGGALLRCQTDDLDWLARELARLPFAFTVLRPAGLRTALAACGRRLLRQARAGPASRPGRRSAARGGGRSSPPPRAATPRRPGG